MSLLSVIKQWFRANTALTIDAKGWLSGPDVVRMPIDPSWYYAKLSTGTPKAIVAHYTATDPGTGRNMARNRQRKRTKDDRAASWHVTIETDGTIIQMAPFTAGCWHAGSDTARKIPGVGWANNTSVGIELVGHGKSFPPEQVAAAARVWRALVATYSIPRELAMVTHRSIDPERRSDPGPVWMSEHAEWVLDEAYAP